VISYEALISKLIGPPDEIKETIPTFLNGDHYTSKIAFTSYSRSGNTLFRKYMENITGVCTGSDGDLRHSLHF
jgi:hypothetical protein